MEKLEEHWVKLAPSTLKAFLSGSLQPQCSEGEGIRPADVIQAEIRSVPGLATWQPGVADVEGDFFSSQLLTLDERKKVFNFRVNETLVPHNPSYIWNLDEKPLLPDVVKGSSFSAGGLAYRPRQEIDQPAGLSCFGIPVKTQYKAKKRTVTASCEMQRTKD